MLEIFFFHIASFPLLHILASCFLVYVASVYLSNGLNRYPGPFMANFTNLWRLFNVWSRRPEVTHIQLHRKYGDVVRLAPNVLSFANPKALKVIYGLNKGFVKVSFTKFFTIVLRVFSP